MRSEISLKQSVLLMILFVFGSTNLIGLSTNNGHYSWMIVILAVLAAIPVMLMYSRIVNLSPNHSLFEAFEFAFGNVLGKIIIVLFALYAIHIAAMALWSFGDFILVASLNQTPFFIIVLTMAIVSAFLAKRSIEVYGKWAIISAIIITTIMIIYYIAAIKQTDFSYLLPLQGFNIKEILLEGFRTLSLPFLELFIFISLFRDIRKGSKTHKIYLLVLFVSGIISLFSVICSLAIIGPVVIKISNYPMYTTAKVLSLTDWISRIEQAITVVFTITTLTKMSLCVLIASKSAAYITKQKKENSYIFPIALFMLAISTILYDSAIQMRNFIDLYKYYAFPIQVILPLILWIVLEIKTRKHSKLVEKAILE